MVALSEGETAGEPETVTVDGLLSDKDGLTVADARTVPENVALNVKETDNVGLAFEDTDPRVMVALTTGVDETDAVDVPVSDMNFESVNDTVGV